MPTLEAATEAVRAELEALQAVLTEETEAFAAAKATAAAKEAKAAKAAQAAQNAIAAEASMPGTKAYAAFLSHFKAEAAMEARYLHEELENAFPGRRIFLDSGAAEPRWHAECQTMSDAAVHPP